MKIPDLDEEELNVLSTVQVHKLGEEHNVGLFNYEISIRGKKNFEAASRKLVLNKSDDLIFNPQTNTSYKNLRKAAKEIKGQKINWNLKMLELQEKGYSYKAILKTKIESQKLQDMEYLKQQQTQVLSPAQNKLKRSWNKYLSQKKKTNEFILK